ncbi:hypothetical protein F441_06914 [Phytophthora nicotianae CJ01A1]|uniref:Uncharacterized protein n=1 Tax=Phytophthora nicotianae CJ01A1 TaxID=1317063 RepID=W2X887_PHYNI|nr:hypothetical protein F441_06914 [Phytophthora nicotianae CJ01A1]
MNEECHLPLAPGNALYGYLRNLNDKDQSGAMAVFQLGSRTTIRGLRH